MTKSGTLLRVNDQNLFTFQHANERGLGTILWVIDENMGTNLQASSAVCRYKNSNYIL